MTIDLERRVTAPDFTTDPLGYFVWHLETHPDMYRQFRQTADAYRAGDPARRPPQHPPLHAGRAVT